MEVKELNKRKKVTTVKLSTDTKSRLDHFKVHPKETYEEIITRMLEILNVCRVNPAKARFHLMTLDKQKRYMEGLFNDNLASKPGETAIRDKLPEKKKSS